MLKIDRVTKRFGSSTAVDGVSMDLEPRRTHVFVGSSGSGKSTLLRMILGLIEADRGSIELDGFDVKTMSARQRAQRMGYVPQEGGLFPHLNGFDNVSIVARSLGWPLERSRARASELAEVVSVEQEWLERFPSELSGGQRQRLALMRAAFVETEVLVLDEPLGALDPLVRADLQSELKNAFKRLGKTVVLVTHDLREADFLGDRIYLLHEGRLVQSGEFQELRDRPVSPFVSRFFRAQGEGR